jgi:hypothetical protein
MILISDVEVTRVLRVAGPLIVGAAFVWAGAIKALSPHVFQTHLRNLGWIPPRFVPSAVIVIAAMETGWGIALAMNTAPRPMIAITIVALVLMSGMSWWGVRSGRTTDCGCYGGYVVPSLSQSIGINAAYILLLLVTPLPLGDTPITAWKILVSVIAAVACGALAASSLRVLRKTGKFLIDMSPLKVGRAWRSRWGAEVPGNGEYLVSYLGPECPHCKRWVRVLNAVSQSDGLPKVVGIVSAGEKLQEFVEESGIRFPVKTIPQTLMNRLVWGVPATVLVSNGRIQNQWSGNMPPEFFTRFRDAFFSSDGSPKLPEAIGAGM